MLIGGHMEMSKANIALAIQGSLFVEEIRQDKALATMIREAQDVNTHERGTACGL